MYAAILLTLFFGVIDSNIYGSAFTDAELANYENIDRNDRQNLTNICLSDDPVFTLSHPSKGKPKSFVPHCKAYREQSH